MLLESSRRVGSWAFLHIPFNPLLPFPLMTSYKSSKNAYPKIPTTHADPQPLGPKSGALHQHVILADLVYHERAVEKGQKEDSLRFSRLCSNGRWLAHIMSHADMSLKNLYRPAVSCFSAAIHGGAAITSDGTTKH